MTTPAPTPQRSDVPADPRADVAAGPHPGALDRGLVIALDGPASSGKSSVGAAAARTLGYRFFDTGLLYRALTALALRRGIATDDVAGLVGLVPSIELGGDADGRLVRVMLDGMDATAEARGSGVDAHVSAVAQHADVREALLPRQRAMALGGGIVVAGRDIGTVVLPDADVKIFLDASVEERALRRILERGLDVASAEAEAVRAQLRARDDQDRNRAVAPLAAADDAHVLWTDGNTLHRTVELVVAEIRRTGRAPDEAPAPPDDRAAPADPAPPAGAGATRPASGPRPAAGPSRQDPAVRDDLSLLVRMVALVSRIGSRLFARVRWEGLERIPRHGAVILAPNHISNADPVVLGAFATPAMKDRRLHWLGKRELFGWPVFGWIAANGGVHPVDRSTADVEAYRTAIRILEAGQALVIFPEGTRSPTGSLQEAKDGLATLALRSGALVLPIGINGTDLVWPRGRKLPLPWPRRTIVCRVGEPFLVADLVPPGTDRRAAKTLATRAIMGRIAELLEPRHRGVYADAARPAIRDRTAPEP
jgi:CMP/dCMP kinase